MKVKVKMKGFELSTGYEVRGIRVEGGDIELETWKHDNPIVIRGDRVERIMIDEKMGG